MPAIADTAYPHLPAEPDPAELRAAGLAGAVSQIAGYDDGTYRVRLPALVRGHVGVPGHNREARGGLIALEAYPGARAAKVYARLAAAIAAGAPLPLAEPLASALARLRPAWVRSARRSRSNSATALMTAIVSLPVGLARSTPPNAR